MTSLNDVILGGQRWSDRVTGPILTPEWIDYANAAIQELYGILTSTYEDYNIKEYPFTLAGGSRTGNQQLVGPGTPVGDFFQPRALWLNTQGIGPTPFVTITRLPSLNEQNLYSFPHIVPLYGAIPTYWNLIGNYIQLVPVNVGSYQYQLLYVPTMPRFTDVNQPLDPYWLTVNGWEEYAKLGVGIRALVKEESLDTAQTLAALQATVKERILKEAAPRDQSEPKQIVDIKRVRNVWAGWGGSSGGGAPGWGWGGTGSGNW